MPTEKKPIPSITHLRAMARQVQRQQRDREKEVRRHWIRRFAAAALPVTSRFSLDPFDAARIATDYARASWRATQALIDELETDDEKETPTE